MTRRITISFEGIIIVIGFIISLLNSTLLILFTIVFPLLLLLLSGTKGALLSLWMIQLRSILNPGIIVQFEGSAAIAKWGMIFLLSGFIIISCRKKIMNNIIKRVVFLICVFSGYCIFSAILVSSYPLVSAFKVFSYTIPFISVILGIYYVSDVNWTKIILISLGFVLFSGVLVYRHPVGYFRNGYAFQGIISHPNVFGAMLALFVACYIHYEKKLGIRQIPILGFAVLLAVASGSRTGMLSIVIALIVYLFTFELRLDLKIALYILMTIVIGMLLFSTGMFEVLQELLFKGHTDSILYSRIGQINTNMERIISHPITGTGFNVPYQEGIRNWSFSFDLSVENGNIVLALLGDTGIIGIILFAIAFLQIFKTGFGMMATMFFVPFAVSMGEMSFFSTNNFGIVMYFMLAIFLTDAIKKKDELILLLES